VIDEAARPSRLSGLWTLLIGGLLIGLLLVLLDPVLRQEDCPNFGASGNASAFSNPSWDLYLPLLTAGWVVLVIVEQVLPVTRRQRSRTEYGFRAAVAVGLALVGACCGVLPLELVCR
jgi:hypothetical protein